MKNIQKYFKSTKTSKLADKSSEKVVFNLHEKFDLV